jgi:carbonic anhydrase
MNCLSPIDIKINTEVNECSSKCNLTYSYSIAEPNLNMKNYTTYLSYMLTTSSDNIAKLDDEVFNLYEIQIYSPSVHKYNSTNQIAELLMIHSNANNAGHELIISIPISQTGAAISDVGFSNLMSISKTQIPTQSVGTMNALIPSLNLNNFIGKTGYYTYEGNHINNCTQKAYYIVYYPTNFALFISNDYLTNNLISILQNSAISVQNNSNYFFNKNGPNYYFGDGVYMDCIAVNTSDDTIEVPVYSSSFSDSSTGKIILQMIVLFSLLAIVFLIIYMCIINLFKVVKNKTS